MKALILSVTAGQGHHAVAKALQEAFEKRQVQVTILDMFEYVSPVLKDMINNGYLLSTKVLPKGYGKVYEMLQKDTPNKKYSANWLISQILMRELEGYIAALSPDLVVSTHPFSSVTLDMMVQSGVVKGVSAGVVTDFTVVPFWEETRHLDYYVVASPLLAMQLQKKGLDLKKVLPYGIPIESKFSRAVSKEEARTRLDLDPNKRTLLLMSGSMGFGRTDLSVRKLDKLPMDFQALVVFGNNKRLEEKVRGMRLRKDFRLFGYVSNVDLMMDASDCIITKPGGLTSTEALTKGLPMIMINEIPGQESRNTEFLLNNQLAIRASKTFPLEEAVYTLFQNPNLMENLRRNAKAFSAGNSANRTVDTLLTAASKQPG